MNGVEEAPKKRSSAPLRPPSRARAPPPRSSHLEPRTPRAGRSRKLSQHLRVFDDHTRSEIKRKRLDALEADNWAVERRKDGGDPDDDDYNPLEDPGSDEEVAVSGAKRSKKKKKKARDKWNAAQKCKTLQEVLDEAQYHKYPSWAPNWLSIAAAPSRYPPRRFCSVSGVVGKYQCPVTGDYLGSLSAYTTHRETRLKGLI